MIGLGYNPIPRPEKGGKSGLTDSLGLHPVGEGSSQDATARRKKMGTSEAKNNG